MSQTAEQQKQRGWMVSIPTYSNPGFASIASVLGSAGFAEAALAFKHVQMDGKIPVEMRDNLSLISETSPKEFSRIAEKTSKEPLATEGDVISEVKAAANTAGVSMDDPSMLALRASLTGLINKPLSVLRDAAASQREQFVAAAAARAGEVADTRAERLAQMQAEVQNIYERQRELLRQMHASGQISDQTLRENLAAIDRTEQVDAQYGYGSEQSAAAHQEATDSQTRAAEEARRNGGPSDAPDELQANAQRAIHINERARAEVQRGQEATEARRQEIAEQSRQTAATRPQFSLDDTAPAAETPANAPAQMASLGNTMVDTDEIAAPLVQNRPAPTPGATVSRMG